MRGLAGELSVSTDAARRYPARHDVTDGMLMRDGQTIPVVVKRTRTDWRQRLTVTKAERSYRIARALLERGIPTPEPLGFEVGGGDSTYVARRVEGAVQIREWFLHRGDAARPAPSLPIPLGDVLRALAGLARKMHDSGVFFRDLSDGNVLVTGGPEGVRLWLVDLNRARIAPEGLGLWKRLRDLSRPGIDRLEDHGLLLAAYFAPEPPPAAALPIVRLLRRRRVLWDALKRRLRPWRRSRVISSAG